MPPLTMRGRYLMREYWSDSDLFVKLTPGEREMYVGLWMLADDDGWLPRDVVAIAAALYRYEDRVPREAYVRLGLTKLARLGKVESLRCGCIRVPVVQRFPRAGKRSYEHRDAHKAHSNRIKRNRTHSMFLPDPTQPNPSLPDPSSRAPAPEAGGGAETEFQRLVPRPIKH